MYHSSVLIRVDATTTSALWMPPLNKRVVMGSGALCAPDRLEVWAALVGRCL